VMKRVTRTASELGCLLVAWFVVWFVISCLIRMLVRDPVTQLAGPLSDPVTRHRFAEEFGMNRALPGDALNRAVKMLRGNWGISWRTRLPVRTLVSAPARLSISTALVATVTALVIAMLLVVIAPSRRYSYWLRVPRDGGLVLAAIPAFVLALWISHSDLPHWLGMPRQGIHSAGVPLWKALFLPCFCLAIPGLGFAIPRLRVAVDQIVLTPWYRNTLALGIPPRRSLIWHGGPLLLAASGDAFVQVMLGSVTGAVAVEYVFALPGLGTALVDAVQLGDAPMILGVVGVTTIVTFGALAIRSLSNMALPPGWRTVNAGE
jgi:peptide/nickel transport system permease protein